MIGVLRKRGNLGTEIHTEEQPWENTGRRRLSISKGERSQKKLTLLTP